MTSKADFLPEEWNEILEAPMTAGMIVLTAAGGGMFRETFALARAYTDARKEHGASELLDEIVSTRPEFDRHRFGSNEELHDKGLQQLGDVAALLRAKATPDEQEAYRSFVLEVASKVAGAHKEEGQAVSGPEQSALDEVRARLQNEA
jgi:hypothetical protein